MIEPCRCPDALSAQSCNRAGMPMSLRLYELCSGNCPPSRPCSAQDSAAYRALWDGQIQEPGLIRKAANFAVAVVSDLANGRARRDEADRERIMGICRACEPYFRETSAGNGRCVHLGCGCSLADKAAWESEQCPIGKW